MRYAHFLVFIFGGMALLLVCVAWMLANNTVPPISPMLVFGCVAVVGVGALGLAVILAVAAGYSYGSTRQSPIIRQVEPAPVVPIIPQIKPAVQPERVAVATSISQQKFVSADGVCRVPLSEFVTIWERGE